MQFAERWIGSSLIVAGVIALAPALALRGVTQHHRYHHHHGARVDFTPQGCADEVVPRVVLHAPPRVQQREPEPPPAGEYASVFESAAPAFAACMRGGATVQLLIKITPAGRVATVTTRPDPETRQSRCLENAIMPLRFPPGREGVVLRVPFSAP